LEEEAVAQLVLSWKHCLPLFCRFCLFNSIPSPTSPVIVSTTIQPPFNHHEDLAVPVLSTCQKEHALSTCHRETTLLKQAIASLFIVSPTQQANKILQHAAQVFAHAIPSDNTQLTRKQGSTVRFFDTTLTRKHLHIHSSIQGLMTCVLSSGFDWGINLKKNKTKRVGTCADLVHTQNGINPKRKKLFLNIMELIEYPTCDVLKG
jgi:hypothetical protein